ncbi:MAG TPA: YciI family protein [Gaiellaceae bacterium]|nr:YciI family protein [Gaiellaceae bacterium]
MPICAYKLFSPRPTFPGDMTPEEGATMAAHVSYWTKKAEQGTAVAFGPVHDPAGVWGIAIIEVESAGEAEALRDGDPAVLNGVGRVEIYPMPGAITSTSVQAASAQAT